MRAVELAPAMDDTKHFVSSVVHLNVLCLMVPLCPSKGNAQGGGIWTAAGTLSAARANHTATPLVNCTCSSRAEKALGMSCLHRPTVTMLCGGVANSRRGDQSGVMGELRIPLRGNSSHPLRRMRRGTAPLPF